MAAKHLKIIIQFGESSKTHGARSVKFFDVKHNHIDPLFQYAVFLWHMSGKRGEHNPYLKDRLN